MTSKGNSLGESLTELKMTDVEGSSSSGKNDIVLSGNSSSAEVLLRATKISEVNLEDAESAMSSKNYRLQRCASTPALAYGSSALGFRPVAVSITGPCMQIPIVGYEVMEERARFTVYKLKIDNKVTEESWFIFRRYTDFVRLHSKLKAEFPDKVLSLPRKKWFGNNFSVHFIEERIQGLQSLIDSITNDTQLLTSQSSRDFFCLDEPPSYSEIGEESRAIFESFQDTIVQLRCQLRAKEEEMWNMRIAVTEAQGKAVTLTQKIREVSTCDECREKIQNISEDLQRVLCSKFTSSFS